MEIKEIVKSYGTQKKFAEHFNIPQKTVEAWCQGIRHCPEYTKQMIIKILQYEQK